MSRLVRNVTARRISRRAVLRGGAAALTLPWLECMADAADSSAQPPQRMLIVCNNIGLLPQNFFPTTNGPDYELSSTLATLAEHRDDFTVFSGLSHPGVTGAHSTDNCFLTAARGGFKAGFRNTISLDQFAAERLGQQTRLPTLNLGVNVEKALRSLAWTRDGALLPAEDSPRRVYEAIFVRGDAAAVERQLARLDARGSILDALDGEAGRFTRSLGSSDRARLEQYVTSIREVERRLATTREWDRRPPPAPPVPAPTDIASAKQLFERLDLMFDVARLALESDSTRIVTLMVDAFRTPVFELAEGEASTDIYHNLSHHGRHPEKIRQLEAADRRHMESLRRLLASLADTREADARLLDHTMVLYGSNLGDANIHDTTNLPIILAGGGFRHGRHVAYSREHNTPLCNLFVTMLERLGVEDADFASSTGRISDI
jgi:hypothetical protein